MTHTRPGAGVSLATRARLPGPYTRAQHFQYNRASASAPVPDPAVVTTQPG